MHAFFPTPQDFADSSSWPSITLDVHPPNPIISAQLPLPGPPADDRDEKDDRRARNKIAAKKWRNKQDEMLYSLEGKNDRLRAEAFDLRKQLMALKTETHVLESELRFFQSFMTKIMKVPPQESPGPCRHFPA
jgi:hypothetical protein